MPPLIELDNVTKVYPMGSQLVAAVAGVSLAIEEGEL